VDVLRLIPQPRPYPGLCRWPEPTVRHRWYSPCPWRHLTPCDSCDATPTRSSPSRLPSLSLVWASGNEPSRRSRRSKFVCCSRRARRIRGIAR
jgi:hypothetical protein